MIGGDLELTIVLLAGLVTGVLGAVLGTGGGVFLVPVLVLGLGVPMHSAVATSIVTVVATSSAVASVNVARGTANMRLGMTLEIATSMGAIAGAVTAAYLAPAVLEAMFAVLITPTAILMWRGRSEEGEGADEPAAGSIEAPKSQPSGDSLGALGGQYVEERTGQVVSYHVRRPAAGMGVAFLAGNVSGLLGIGGGVFKVPALHLLCSVPIKAAAATSNFMIGVTAAASAFLYYGRGDVRPALTAATVLGVVVGSMVGSAVNRYVNAGLVRRLFAVLLFGVAAQMLYEAWTH